MARALHLAAENARNGNGGPFAAIVARGEETISEGTNLVTSSNDPTAHAEIVAIRLACASLQTFQLAGCELYTSCEPCPMCLGAIYWARPSLIYYCGTHKDAANAGFDDTFIYQQTRLPVRERSIPMLRVLPDQANVPFDAWRMNLNRIQY